MEQQLGLIVQPRDGTPGPDLVPLGKALPQVGSGAGVWCLLDLVLKVMGEDSSAVLGARWDGDAIPSGDDGTPVRLLDSCRLAEQGVVREVDMLRPARC